jgi:hypothetical protein
VLDWSPSSVRGKINLDFLDFHLRVEEIWFWDSGKVFSDLVFVAEEVSISVIELDVIEVTIDRVHTSRSSEVEDQFSWWGVMVDLRDGDSSVIFRTNKGRVDFVFFNRVTGIDIEPITIDFGVFEVNLFTDISIRSV